MHLTVLEFTSILPVPFPEIQILIIIDKKRVLFVNCRSIYVKGFTKKIPNHIRIATHQTTIRPMKYFHRCFPLILWSPPSALNLPKGQMCSSNMLIIHIFDCFLMLPFLLLERQDFRKFSFEYHKTSGNWTDNSHLALQASFFRGELTKINEMSTVDDAKSKFCF